jgi:hypothetical protein
LILASAQENNWHHMGAKTQEMNLETIMSNENILALGQKKSGLFRPLFL